MMKTKMIFLLAISFVLASFNLYAQDGWGQKVNYNKLYDINKVETISGQVKSIDNIVPDSKTAYDMYMVLTTRSGDVKVQLGSGQYIEKQDIHINADDYVTIKGSNIIYMGIEMIIAAEVTKDEKKLLLRDVNGNPLWLAEGVIVN